MKKKDIFDKEKIKGIIFDLDGVLLDSMGIWKDLGARYIRSLGKEPEEGLWKVLFSMSMEQGAEYMVREYSLAETADEVLEGIQEMLKSFYYYEVPAKKGAEKLLAEFEKNGMKMTAATSSPRTHVEKALERNGLLKYIEKIFTSSETGTSKHEPDIYHLAAAFMGTKLEETLVLEDSLYALKTAKDAGYMTIGVFDAEGESDQMGMEETADIYIRELTDILAE